MIKTMIVSILSDLLPMILFALRVLVAFIQVLVSSAFRALRRNARLKPVPPEALDLPLLAARLSDLPYQVDSAEAVERAIATLLQDSALLHFEEQALMETNAVCEFSTHEAPPSLTPRCGCH